MSRHAMDFATLVRHLEVHGLTHSEIARRAQCHQQTVWQLANRRVTEPRYSLGVRLVAILKQVSIETS